MCKLHSPKDLLYYAIKEHVMMKINTSTKSPDATESLTTQVLVIVIPEILILGYMIQVLFKTAGENKGTESGKQNVHANELLWKIEWQANWCRISISITLLVWLNKSLTFLPHL